ncbi:MAG TPA: GntR family transcriptional regulator [Steroidobacteraceae bacterium]|nr:GntR family transcriptional regulator [Steroidobacteraceae bacterium]
MDASRTAESSTSLRDMVLRRVRADIVSGYAGPGTMYSVPTLAEEIGVSTTPVREALLELSYNGLITPVRNRGFRVEAATLEDLRNGFALRELLERFAMVSLAEKRLTDTEPLRKLADEIAAAVKRKDVRGYIDSDRAFHLELVSRLSNPMLTKMIMELRDGMRLYGIDSAAGRQRQVASVKEHYQLIDLASAGETDAIAKLITQHIRSWEPVFTAGLSERLGRTLRSRGR